MKCQQFVTPPNNCTLPESGEDNCNTKSPSNSPEIAETEVYETDEKEVDETDEMCTA